MVSRDLLWSKTVLRRQNSGADSVAGLVWDVTNRGGEGNWVFGDFGHGKITFLAVCQDIDLNDYV